MLNWIFLILIASAVLTAAFTGRMPAVTGATLQSAKTAVELSIGLVGQMALWLGLLGILREAGLMRSLARALEPLMTRLFPDVPRGHPAMGSMLMNLSATMLGLSNAATPFGLKAMAELNTLNRHPGVASNAMATFLAINASGVTLVPIGVIAVRAALGSNDPAGIIVPTLIATTVNTVAAVFIVRWLQGRRAYALPPAPEPETVVEAAPTMAARETPEVPDVPGASGWRLWLGWALVAAVVGALALHFAKSTPESGGAVGALRAVFSEWLLPLLVMAGVVFGFGRRVKVYEVFVASAKEGFQIAVTIIPFLVAILVAVGMFRASGAMEALVTALTPVTGPLGFPPEALPMALVRPFSGSGSLALTTEAMKAYGADSFVGYLVSILNGSSETTFYILAVYFGSVQVRAMRHTVLACLAADLLGVIAATAMCHLFFG